MKVNVLFFGQLTDITQRNNVQLDDIPDISALDARLQQLYPKLVGTKYIISVNSAIVQENIVLSNNDEVALLPPFSGG